VEQGLQTYRIVRIVKNLSRITFLSNTACKVDDKLTSKTKQNVRSEYFNRFDKFQMITDHPSRGFGNICRRFGM
jgi:hypothetical protein